jgi:formate C-acetyltransferase
MAQLLVQLHNNFSDEIIHQMCIHRAPKYGNDDPLVDEYAARILHHFCDYLRTQRGIFKGGFFPQPFTFLWLIEAGERTAATPDGRHKGDNLAYSLSPMQGRDFTGLTAMLNSLAKLPHHKAAGGPSAIIEVDPELFTSKNMDTMVSIVQSAIEKGVGQMQFNVINATTLQTAQAHPDQYAQLAVRVSGFSQRFCLLDKKLQDHIIARTKHQTL